MRIPRRLIAGVAVLAVAGVGYAGYAAAADDPSYRTARATIGDLEETVDLTGTVEPAGRADLAFATSGTVARVTVEPGEKVTAGQVLGRLDDGSLREAVQRARSTLASARAQLESDIAAQTEAVSDASTGDTQSPQSGGQVPQSGGQSPQGQSPQGESPQGQSPSASPSTDPDDDSGVDLDALAAQQQAVLTAQTAVSTSLAAAQDALAAQQAACTATPEAAVSQECSDALTAVQAAQQQVATDQQALQDALEALADTLTAALGDETSAAANAAVATTADEPAIVLVAATTGSSSGMSGGTVTAATLAKDQASIDQARADLLTAQQELAMATVTAPFAGRVVAVDAGAGDSVAAGTAVFVLVSQGTTTVQVSVSSTQVQELEVGQVARATPAGADTALRGAVTQVSSVPASDSTYAVTITLRRKHLDIATGLTASVAVVTGTASDVVTVPASAVSDGRVTLLEDGVATPTPVTTGVTGATRVEITDGLAKGDEVVLADLDAALPTGDTETNNRVQLGGPGGFGGTGGPPTGFQRPGQ
ncbi:hypothetical protein ASC77_03835 [Nocardioides sp. Root1257]|uniref:efflux RND transporter periplasmic adaptor subunit n=1 Tax=unclassified Nocardioides TaxID=2615069 RepID=UPI0006FBD101|nr:MULTISPECIES: HlyD family efflux transporter periplasmic adaptor subunit [unclassified Nocardioides]KQW53423.1 hypothetical protein ASC77_03835 [Nocardioides sp. Root1257]KRC56109.1 hypothetical protein ASE24_03835 [Nocardioides sp. Root224]